MLAGSRSFIVARARCSALFTAATLISSTAAVSFADQSSASRRIRTARWRGGRCWIAARNASSIVSRATTDVIRLGALVEQEIGVRLQPGKVGRRQRAGAELGGGARVVGHEAPRTALEDPEAGVGRDPVEPGAERRAPVVGRAAAPRAEERLLDRVLGVLERAEHPVGVHLELGAVPFDERRERGRVAARRRGDQPLVEPD